MQINNILKDIFHPLPSHKNYSITLRDEIYEDKPSMIARFGSVEIKGVLYPQMPLIIRTAIRKRIFYSMKNNAGFFSISDSTINKFSKLMIQDMHHLDIIGSWRIEEKLLLKNFPQAKRVELSALEPYLSNDPWSEALEGRKILVIHPFNDLIEQQYNEKREFLFENKRVLPKFKSLETVKAVQTIAGAKAEFDDWFSALESMKMSIDSKDYDIAIIGCGAYGFPLAAHIKRTGKKAIHLGGATQILFGIKGRRWDNHPKISKLYNDHWIRPSLKHIPTGASKVENACYW